MEYQQKIEQYNKGQYRFKAPPVCTAGWDMGAWIKWIDADQDADSIQEEVDEMLKNSPEPNAEEWAIHDYDMFGIEISEYESFETVAELGQLLAEHGEAFSLFAQIVDTAELTGEKFIESYLGERSAEDYTYDYAQDCMNIPDHIEPYFDYDKLEDELFKHGTMHEVTDSKYNRHCFDLGR